MRETGNVLESALGPTFLLANHRSRFQAAREGMVKKHSLLMRFKLADQPASTAKRTLP